MVEIVGFGKATKEIRKLIAPFTDPALAELGEFVADKVRFLRFKNCVRCLRRAEALLKDQGQAPREVSPKILVEILSGVALEEEEELVELWSQLLATAGNGISVHMQLISLLKQLSVNDARLLDFLSREFAASETAYLSIYLFRSPPPDMVVDTELRLLSTTSEDSYEHLLLSFEILRSLGLFSQYGRHDITTAEYSGTEAIVLHQVSTTLLGRRLVSACGGAYPETHKIRGDIVNNLNVLLIREG